MNTYKFTFFETTSLIKIIVITQTILIENHEGSVRNIFAVWRDQQNFKIFLFRFVKMSRGLKFFVIKNHFFLQKISGCSFSRLLLLSLYIIFYSFGLIILLFFSIFYYAITSEAIFFFIFL